ncbi:Dynein regulatory complex protein 11 [Kappamyces sp. JEL0829]|nr:Dynein regulatory complex protein 11 [Kappamyces sp. JEL0829]
MSNSTYNKYWAEANTAFHELQLYEKPADPGLQMKDREGAFQHMAVLYVKYIQLYRKLEDAYDGMLHPQKRRLLKEAVVACMGRLIEVKHILVELECSDYLNFNDILQDLNLSPDALRVPIPRHLLEERAADVEARKNLLGAMNAKDFSFGATNSLFPDFSLDAAIKIIQNNERGRQGKLRAKYMRDLRLEAQREKMLISHSESQDNGSAKAALTIQRVYRGFRGRQVARKLQREELVFLGMEEKLVDAKADPINKNHTNRSRRKVLQKQFEDDYLQALLTTKEKILRMEGPDMKEAIQDDFRQWYMEYKRINGKFPEFPEEEVWKQPDFKFTLETTDAKPAAPEPEKSEKDSKKDGKKDSKKDEEVVDPTEKFRAYADSQFLELGKKQNDVYDRDWRHKDESENFSQKHDQEIIKANKRKEVEAEIKNEVFEVLADELRNLKLAVEKEGKKGKKGGKGGKKGGKKGKKDKGKKGKKEKDLTANRTMESLVEELVMTGLLQSYSPRPLSSFIGHFNITDTSVSKDLVVAPSLGELQRVGATTANDQTLVEYCVLPMGVSRTDNDPPFKHPKIASVLLTGPSGTGKTMLVQALATEMGAQIFNLSPRNTAGQFVGKANVVKMIHMVFKVARAQGPSIIYIDGFEMIFAKKVPKDDTSDPKRIKKDLGKAIKLIRDHSEKVVLIATSNKPWDGDLKAMLPLFDKVLYAPKPDYGSRYLLWKEFINRNAADTARTLNIGLLARMSDGFSTGLIEMIAARVMTPRRMRRTKCNPLRTDEFVDYIIDSPLQNPDEAGQFKDFLEKIAKKREIMLAGPVEEEAPKKKK